MPAGNAPRRANCRAAAADADLHPAAAERVDDGEVLGQPERVLQRQDRDRGGELDPLGARGRVREEGPRRRQPAAAEGRMVLRHPAHVKPQFVSNDEQLLRVAVGDSRAPLALHVREEAEPEARLTWLVGHGRCLS
jgi:hypothetical protein